jgi:NAD(P)-dependent dehydrogenase (short-subunit alcohol dehydrogenase family)
MKKVKFLSIMLAATLLIFGSSLVQAQENDQKVILITGTASGIGKATAELLISEGHIVYGGDIQFEKNRYLDDIGGHSIDMDVTDTAMVRAGVERVIKEQGRIDVLFNNAGFGLYAPVEETTEEDLRYQFEVNVFGVANVTRAVLPYMRPQNSGMIINTSSMGGKIYMPLGAWYHATKHAIEGWSDCLRLELKEFNIDVVIIEPGAINTNFGNVTTGYMQKYIEESNYSHMLDGFVNMMADMTPEQMERMGSDPIVIAEVVNRAINARNPNTRYVKGRMGKFMIRYRDWFGDRAFDRLMMRMFN